MLKVRPTPVVSTTRKEIEVKITARMKQIVAFMRENDGVIEVEENGDSQVVEITIHQQGKVIADQYVSGKVFGTCTEYMIEKLCKAKLIVEDDSDGRAKRNKSGGYGGCTTVYRLSPESR